ncbi:MAG: geranylgeranylglycerol-phosphate geranylgeranyltransferase [Acidobacteriota bacterium]|nr:geranylgeranylglycerol-phosphate geranylgeranyltransferase [Acidobacteriota bacterium]
MAKGTTISGFLSLIRLPNGLIAVLSTVMAGVVTARSFDIRPAVFLGAGIVWLILSGGNALNDFFDRHIDKVNRPRRPIPSGRITGRQAVVFSWILLSLGLGLSLALGLKVAAFAAANILILVIYARWSKSLGLLANLAVGWLTASVFLFAAIIQGHPDVNILALSLSAFFIMTSREILKDIEDMEGDREGGAAATLPIRVGPGRARTAAVLAALPAVPLIVLPSLNLGMNVLFPVFAVPAAATVVYSFFPNPRAAQRSIKIAVILVLLAYVFGVLSTDKRSRGSGHEVFDGVTGEIGGVFRQDFRYPGKRSPGKIVQCLSRDQPGEAIQVRVGETFVECVELEHPRRFPAVLRFPERFITA